MTPSSSDVRPIIIDTDPGVDDALAFMLAFRSPEVRVGLITTVAGNVPVDQGTDNACRLLTLLEVDPWPPLVKGASRPLTRSLETATHVHGGDGLGGLTGLKRRDGTPRFPLPATKPSIGRQAATRIIEQVEAQGPALTIVALGPLTNIAQAVRQAPDTMRRVGHLIVMGGAMAGPGNMTPAAEFNIFVDPQAAAIVANSGMRMTWVPLDVTHQVRLTKAMRDQHLAGQNSNLAQAIRQVTRALLQGRHQTRGMPLHDPLAMAVAIDPEVVSCTALPLRVETQGEHTRGMTVADRRDRAHAANDAPVVDIALHVDADRMLSLFAERVLNTRSQTRPAPEKPQAQVVVVGGANVDLTIQTPNLPQRGETVQGDTVLTAFGGKGANQALAAKRAGAQVAFVGKLGEDSYGRDLARFLRQEQIDITGTRTSSDLPSGVALITVDRRGQNQITVATGANAALTPDDLDGLAPLLGRSQVLVSQLENPLDTIEAALRQAKAAGLITVLNPAPARKLPARMASLIDYLIPNEVEAAFFIGQTVRTPKQAGQAALKLQQAGYRHVIVTLGKQGLVYTDGETPVHLPGVDVDAVDATAAGDTFVGYFACAIAEGQALADALALANAAAALSVTKFGAMPSIPSRSQI